MTDVLRQMEADGVERALAFVTSTFGSYNGCRKYREDLYRAVRALERPPRIDRLRYGYNHPGFVAAVAERVRDALAEVPARTRDDAPVVFTAHSLPEGAARRAPYVEQLRESCALVAEGLGRPGSKWRLAFQSRNARYGPEDWLGPDIGDALAEEKANGATDVVVAPIGFVCEHLEVVLDLDVEAKERADELGLNMVRAAYRRHPPRVRRHDPRPHPRAHDREPGAVRARLAGAEPRLLPLRLLSLRAPGAAAAGPLRPSPARRCAEPRSRGRPFRPERGPRPGTPPNRRPASRMNPARLPGAGRAAFGLPRPLAPRKGSDTPRRKARHLPVRKPSNHAR